MEARRVQSRYRTRSRWHHCSRWALCWADQARRHASHDQNHLATSADRRAALSLRRHSELHCATVRPGKHWAHSYSSSQAVINLRGAVLVVCWLTRFSRHLPSLPEDDRQHR